MEKYAGVPETDIVAYLETAAKKLPWAEHGDLKSGELIPWFVKDVLEPRVKKLMAIAEQAEADEFSEDRPEIPFNGIKLLKTYNESGEDAFVSQMVDIVNGAGPEMAAYTMGLGGDFSWPGVAGDAGPALLRLLFGQKTGYSKELMSIYPDMERLKQFKKEDSEDQLFKVKRKSDDLSGGAKVLIERHRDEIENWLRDDSVSVEELRGNIWSILKDNLRGAPNKIREITQKTKSYLLGTPGQEPKLPTKEAVESWLWDFSLGSAGHSSI